MFTYSNIILHIFPRNQYKPNVVISQYKKQNYKLKCIYIYMNKIFEGIGTFNICNFIACTNVRMGDTMVVVVTPRPRTFHRLRDNLAFRFHTITKKRITVFHGECAV